jgi:hypothetical protein
VAADRPLKARCPDKHPQDAEAPARGAVLAGIDPPTRKRRAPIVGAGHRKGLDGAGLLAPAGGERAVTAEARDLASAGQAVLAPEDGRDLSAADGKVTARAEGNGDNLNAAQRCDPVQEAGPARAGVRDLAPIEVEQCDSAVVLNRALVADVDSAPALDGAVAKDLVQAEVEIWTPAAGRVRDSIGQTKVRGQVAARALAGRLAGSDHTEVRMQMRLRRSSRNRNFHQKRYRV